MDERMDGWMNGQTDGWMDGRKGQADRWTLFYSTLPAETGVQKFFVFGFVVPCCFYLKL